MYQNLITTCIILTLLFLWKYILSKSNLKPCLLPVNVQVVGPNTNKEGDLTETYKVDTEPWYKPVLLFVTNAPFLKKKWLLCVY